MTANLLNKIDVAFKYYTGWSIYDDNPHFYIDSHQLNDSFSELINEINDNIDTLIYVKEDMPLKVFVLKDYVIRVCLSSLYYVKYNKIFNLIREWRHSNLESIHLISDIGKYVIIVSKRVEPLIVNNNINKNINIDFEKLYYDITTVINDLKDINAVHGDVSLDNIGYDSELDKYILFDYDKFKMNESSSIDYHKLEVSLQFYMNR